MAIEKAFKVGVDVEGTNTDCVILNPNESDAPNRGIRSAMKTPTTPNVTEGIVKAIEGAISQCEGMSRDSISAVMIGTTSFINAVVQADERSLRKVGVLRICGPYTRENPAFLDFPPILARIMNGHVAYLDGGLESDTREIMKLDEQQVLREKGITDVAVCGVFSQLDLEGLHEARVRRIVLEEIPGADVILSQDVGQLGLLERENATILNTSILKHARKTIRGFKQAITWLGLSCPLFLTQNDGTIIDADVAETTPIKTFNSGPTNSMSGAAYLAGLDTASSDLPNAQVIVADVGGTTCDVCALLPSGFPRQAGTWVEIGGVRCAFAMPEVQSIALGGGTRVEERDGQIHIGPESVGHRLLQDGLVFGNSTLTTTGIVVASNKADIGDSSRVSHVPARVVEQARLKIKHMLEAAIDSMKLTADDCICVMAGGGSIVQMDELKGVGRIIRPQFHDCAKAVGAAIARVSGQIDIVKTLEGLDEDKVVEGVCDEARKRAIDAGADPDKVKITEIENLPLQYVSTRAFRIVVKAAGPLARKALLKGAVSVSRETDNTDIADLITSQHAKSEPKAAKDLFDFIVSPSAYVSVADYRPEVDGNGVWWISEIDCEFLAMGSSILACGGGGPGYLCYMAGRDAIRRGKRMSVVDIDTLSEDGWILGNISYGAPTVTLERTPSGTEGMCF